MGKRRQKQQEQWLHTPEGMLNLLVELCLEKGRVVSQRAVKKDPFVDYKEVIALLGRNGGWPAVEKQIMQALEVREKNGSAEGVVRLPETDQRSVSEKDTEVEQEITAVDETDQQPVFRGNEMVEHCLTDKTNQQPVLGEKTSDEVVRQDCVAEEGAQKGKEIPGPKRQSGYTMDELLGMLDKMEKHLNRFPMVKDFARLKREGWETPCQATFRAYLGPKAEQVRLLSEYRSR